jgi:hypothetical protein
MVLAGSLLLSFVLGAAIVLFGLSAVGLGRYTTGPAGQATGIAGGLAGMVGLFAYLSYQYYRAYEK